tara:strand:+ start:36364 stop:37506 length:1143 start_codon:yes stop_codon:yes gene_type:complete
LNKDKLIYIVAGEPSGDFIGGQLISKLSEKKSNLRFYGVGGINMENHNFKSLFPISELSVMGILPVLLKINSLFRRINNVVEDIIDKEPDIVVLIDSPDFNHRVAKRLKKKSFQSPVICYVAPSAWAWRENRVKSMTTDFDHLFCLLPFERDFFTHRGLKTTYVGHPVIPKILTNNNKESFREIYNIKKKPILVFLPGSRVSEIKRHIKPFKDAFNEIKKKIPDIILAIPIHRKNKSLIEREFKNSIIVLSEKEKFLLFKDANVACASSGTVTLELGLSLLPMLVIYKLDFLTWSIVRRLAKVRFISLINLVLNKNSVTELIQNKCNKNNIYQSLLGLFFDKEILDKQINDLKNFRKIILSDKDDPTEKAAKKILEFIEK